jgi:beta-galactosidase
VGLRTTGLSSGSVWINGHNLGRYFGNVSLYVPECWLVADNTQVNLRRRRELAHAGEH